MPGELKPRRGNTLVPRKGESYSAAIFRLHRNEVEFPIAIYGPKNRTPGSPMPPRFSNLDRWAYYIDRYKKPQPYPPDPESEIQKAVAQNTPQGPPALLKQARLTINPTKNRYHSQWSCHPYRGRYLFPPVHEPTLRERRRRRLQAINSQQSPTVTAANNNRCSGRDSYLREFLHRQYQRNRKHDHKDNQENDQKDDDQPVKHWYTWREKNFHWQLYRILTPKMANNQDPDTWGPWVLDSNSIEEFEDLAQNMGNLEKSKHVGEEGEEGDWGDETEDSQSPHALYDPLADYGGGNGELGSIGNPSGLALQSGGPTFANTAVAPANELPAGAFDPSLPPLPPLPYWAGQGGPAGLGYGNDYNGLYGFKAMAHTQAAQETSGSVDPGLTQIPPQVYGYRIGVPAPGEPQGAPAGVNGLPFNMFSVSVQPGPVTQNPSYDVQQPNFQMQQHFNYEVPAIHRPNHEMLAARRPNHEAHYPNFKVQYPSHEVQHLNYGVPTNQHHNGEVSAHQLPNHEAQHPSHEVRRLNLQTPHQHQNHKVQQPNYGVPTNQHHNRGVSAHQLPNDEAKHPSHEVRHSNQQTPPQHPAHEVQQAKPKVPARKPARGPQVKRNRRKRNGDDDEDDDDYVPGMSDNEKSPPPSKRRRKTKPHS